VRGVVVGFDPSGEGPGGEAVELGGSRHVERLVRAKLVELLAEGVELALLEGQAAGGRDRGLPLEGAMNALVDGVLLRPAGLDELGVDAELDEPDGEGGETSQGAGGEGDAVVGADAVGQTELLEEPGEVHLGELKGDGRVGVDAEEEAGGEIADGEGEAVGAVSEAELTLVIGGPDVVGALGRGLGTAWVSATEAAPGAGETFTEEDAAGGGG